MNTDSTRQYKMKSIRIYNNDSLVTFTYFSPVMTVMLGAITVVGDVVDGVKLCVTTVVEMERFGTLIMREIDTEVVVLVVEVMDIVG